MKNTFGGSGLRALPLDAAATDRCSRRGLGIAPSRHHRAFGYKQPKEKNMKNNGFRTQPQEQLSLREGGVLLTPYCVYLSSIDADSSLRSE